MITKEAIENALVEYIQRFVPAMYKWRYHLILAKGGPDYPHLPEQSLFGHVINGVFGLAQLVRFLVERGISTPGLDEKTFRKALALVSIHDVHKLTGERVGMSEFSIPLERLREEYRRLGLDGFADVDEHLMRAANVSKRSSKHGDILLSGEEGSLLWLLVRIADNLASVKGLEEARSSLEGYLMDLRPAFAPKSPPGRYTLHYHEIRDVRGVLTNLIHSVVARQLEADYGFFPLLYFATGTLYLGPSGIEGFERGKLIDGVVDGVLNSLVRYGDDPSAAKEGLRRQKYDFEKYVYAFASVPTLLDLVREETLLAKPDPRVAEKEINGIAGRKGTPAGWSDTVEERFALSLAEPKAFNEHWSRARRYLLYVDTLLRDLNPAEDRLEWFLKAFPIPVNVADNLRQDYQLWAKGGVGKYVLVIAYHFLKGPDFAERSAIAQPPEQVVDALHQRVLEALAAVDTKAGRQGAVAELGFRQDLFTYLEENLYLSFAPETQLTEDVLGAYTRIKRKGHSTKVCSICNRCSDYVRELRTGILSDFGRVFSNRVLPAIEAPGKNRPWCPVCHLEFILRKLAGLSLPAGADYGNSKRIYLYVLPTFSFTPHHVKLFEPLLSRFQRVTNLPIHDYGRDAPSIPRLWLERRELGPEWIEDVMEVLDRQAEWIAERGGRSYVGERIMTSRISDQPNYYLVTWEKAARGTERDDARIATRSEAWAKALFAAVVISGLTSCKVYVTERPYLPVADPADLKPTITLDSPPPILRGILGERTDAVSLYGREKGERSGLERALDLSAALWVVTTNVHAPNRPSKDKHIAERLGLANVEPLAGAHFYKEYSRLNDDQSPFPTLAKACEVLLEIQGGELMGLVEQIAEKSLEIGLPRGAYGRGKTRRYELVFREAMDAMRKAFNLIPELRRTALIGRPPSADSIAELKRLAAGTLLKAMERRQIAGRGEILVNPWRQDLGQLTGEFLDLLVDEVFLRRAGGSFARFLRLENSLADGVYYYTDRVIRQKWEEYQAAKAKE